MPIAVTCASGALNVRHHDGITAFLRVAAAGLLSRALWYLEVRGRRLVVELADPRCLAGVRPDPLP